MMRRLLILSLLCCRIFSAHAQMDDLQVQPQPTQAAIQTRPVSKEKWEDAAKGIDYSSDIPQPPKPPKPPKEYTPPSPSSGIDWTNFTQGWGTFFQILAILLAVAGIGYAIYRIMQEPRNRQISRDGIEITSDNLDAYIHETDLERFLREALNDQNYALAIRLYYLQMIKSLSEKQVIEWARQKTNRDYQREMRQHPLFQQFRLLTQTYESVWYGNQTLSFSNYQKLEPLFKSFLSQV